MGFHGLELELEVFDMAFFSFTKGSLSGFVMSVTQLTGRSAKAIRCSVLSLPPALGRCQVVLVFIAATPARSLVILLIYTPVIR